MDNPRCIGRIDPEDLRRFTKEVFVKVGMKPEHADIVADHLLLADLRGVDSHGALLRVPIYLKGIREKDINPAPNIRIVKEDGISVLVDGDRGLGIIAASILTDKVIEKARRNSVALGGVINIRHAGMLAYYAIKLVRNRLIGLIFANSSRTVAPWGGSKPFLGTNPICIAFPMNDEYIILDMATSAASRGKLSALASRGEKIPEGWGLDKFGRPTTDPREILDGGVLLPFGGYKGYGLSLAADILAATVTGGVNSYLLDPGWWIQGGVFMIAFRADIFRSYEEYLVDLKKLVENLKKIPPAQGFSEVLYPGEIELRNFRERLAKGIPVTSERWSKLLEVARELGIEMPKLLSNEC